MPRPREYLEKLLFPGSYGQRRRHMKFFIIALLLGILVALGIAVILFFLDYRPRNLL